MRYALEQLVELERDAKRWRALMSSQRIRVIGVAGFERDPASGGWTPRAGEYRHIGMEFWDRHEAHGDPRYPQDADRATFTNYVDHLVESGIK